MTELLLLPRTLFVLNYSASRAVAVGFPAFQNSDGRRPARGHHTENWERERN